MTNQLTWVPVGFEEPIVEAAPSDREVAEMAAHILRGSSSFELDGLDGRIFVQSEQWRGCGRILLSWNAALVSEIILVWDVRRAADQWVEVLSTHKQCPGPIKPPRKPPSVPYAAVLYPLDWGKVPSENAIAVSQASEALTYAMLRLVDAEKN